MHVKLILNPYANRWRAKKQLPNATAALDRAGVSYKTVVTQRPLQATEEARTAAEEGFDGVLAAGGDGTLSEIVNGLAQAAGDGQTLPVGVMPIGNGNDFSDMLGLPRDLDAAARTVAIGSVRALDLGHVSTGGTHSYFFANNCALAMEPLVTLESTRLTRLTGKTRYIVAVIRALAKLSAWHMRVAWDDGQYDGTVMLLSVCNGPRAGSTFMMSPEARFDDGLFDVVMVPEIPMRTVLQLLPRMLNGSYLQHPQVSLVRTRTLTVTSNPATPVHADGEMLSEGAAQVSYRLYPGKLQVFAP